MSFRLASKIVPTAMAPVAAVHFNNFTESPLMSPASPVEPDPDTTSRA